MRAVLRAPYSLRPEVRSGGADSSDSSIACGSSIHRRGAAKYHPTTTALIEASPGAAGVRLFSDHPNHAEPEIAHQRPPGGSHGGNYKTGYHPGQHRGSQRASGPARVGCCWWEDCVRSLAPPAERMGFADLLATSQAARHQDAVDDDAAQLT
jgi:hypothetical protein